MHLRLLAVHSLVKQVQHVGVVLLALQRAAKHPDESAPQQAVKALVFAKGKQRDNIFCILTDGHCHEP